MEIPIVKMRISAAVLTMTVPTRATVRIPPITGPRGVPITFVMPDRKKICKPKTYYHEKIIEEFFEKNGRESCPWRK